MSPRDREAVDKLNDSSGSTSAKRLAYWLLGECRYLGNKVNLKDELQGSSQAG